MNDICVNCQDIKLLAFPRPTFHSFDRDLDTFEIRISWLERDLAELRKLNREAERSTRIVHGKPFALVLQNTSAVIKQNREKLGAEKAMALQKQRDADEALKKSIAYANKQEADAKRETELRAELEKKMAIEKAQAQQKLAANEAVSSGQGLLVSLELETAERAGKLIVSGKTNLPNGTKISISLSGQIFGRELSTIEQLRIVNDGTFVNATLPQNTTLAAGAYKLEVRVVTDQPSAIQSIFGEAGKNLSGPYVEVGEDQKKHVVLKRTVLTTGTKSEMAGLGMTPETFRTAFNARVSELNFPQRFQIGRIAVTSSLPTDKRDSFSYSFSDGIGIVGGVDKASREITTLIVFGKGMTPKEAIDLMVLPDLIIAILDSSISKEHRGAVLTKLYHDASENRGQRYFTVDGSLKLSAIETAVDTFTVGIDPHKN